MAVQGSKTLQGEARNTLAIINEVQTRMRFPLSTAITEPHARFLLSQMNIIQRDFMLEGTLWRELKVIDQAAITHDNPLVTLTIAEREIDVITHLQIGTSEPIPVLTDEGFLEYKRAYPNAAQPSFCRIRSREVGNLILELGPTPDADYTLDFEIQVKPPLLAAETDIPLLDIDTIISGVHMLVTMDGGLSYDDKVAAFQAKYMRQEQVQGGSGWGDVEL